MELEALGDSMEAGGLVVVVGDHLILLRCLRLTIPGTLSLGNF